MLLFDQNLSYKLCKVLGGEFPGCRHVREAGLSNADDADVWNHAAANGLMIVSKDQDFRQRAMLLRSAAEMHLDKARQLFDGGYREFA